jgi:DNA transformation protein
MDRDFLLDLFAGFGPVALRRMFSGYGISRDGINFALALRDGIFLRADQRTIPLFEAEGATPFAYVARGKDVTVRSYWRLPERLYDDADELAVWAARAFDAACLAATSKKPRKRGTKTGSKAPTAPAVKSSRKRIATRRQAT